MNLCGCIFSRVLTNRKEKAIHDQDATPTAKQCVTEPTSQVNASAVYTDALCGKPLESPGSPPPPTTAPIVVDESIGLALHSRSTSPCTGPSPSSSTSQLPGTSSLSPASTSALSSSQSPPCHRTRPTAASPSAPLPLVTHGPRGADVSNALSGALKALKRHGTNIGSRDPAERASLQRITASAAPSAPPITLQRTASEIRQHLRSQVPKRSILKGANGVSPGRRAPPQPSRLSRSSRDIATTRQTARACFATPCDVFTAAADVGSAVQGTTPAGYGFGSEQQQLAKLRPWLRTGSTLVIAAGDGDAAAATPSFAVQRLAGTTGSPNRQWRHPGGENWCFSANRSAPLQRLREEDVVVGFERGQEKAVDAGSLGSGETGGTLTHVGCGPVARSVSVSTDAVTSGEGGAPSRMPPCDEAAAEVGGIVNHCLNEHCPHHCSRNSSFSETGSESSTMNRRGNCSDDSRGGASGLCLANPVPPNLTMVSPFRRSAGGYPSCSAASSACAVTVRSAAASASGALAGSAGDPESSPYSRAGLEHLREVSMTSERPEPGTPATRAAASLPSAGPRKLPVAGMDSLQEVLGPCPGDSASPSPLSSGSADSGQTLGIALQPTRVVLASRTGLASSTTHHIHNSGVEGRAEGAMLPSLPDTAVDIFGKSTATCRYSEGSGRADRRRKTGSESGATATSCRAEAEYLAAGGCADGGGGMWHRVVSGPGEPVDLRRLTVSPSTMMVPPPRTTNGGGLASDESLGHVPLLPQQQHQGAVGLSAGEEGKDRWVVAEAGRHHAAAGPTAPVPDEAAAGAVFSSSSAATAFKRFSASWTRLQASQAEQPASPASAKRLLSPTSGGRSRGTVVPEPPLYSTHMGRSPQAHATTRSSCTGAVDGTTDMPSLPPRTPRTVSGSGAAAGPMGALGAAASAGARIAGGVSGPSVCVPLLSRACHPTAPFADGARVAGRELLPEAAMIEAAAADNQDTPTSFTWCGRPLGVGHQEADLLWSRPRRPAAQPPSGADISGGGDGSQGDIEAAAARSTLGAGVSGASSAAAEVPPTAWALQDTSVTTQRAPTAANPGWSSLANRAGSTSATAAAAASTLSAAGTWMPADGSTWSHAGLGGAQAVVPRLVALPADLRSGLSSSAYLESASAAVAMPATSSASVTSPAFTTATNTMTQTMTRHASTTSTVAATSTAAAAVAQTSTLYNAMASITARHGATTFTTGTAAVAITSAAAGASDSITANRAVMAETGAGPEDPFESLERAERSAGFSIRRAALDPVDFLSPCPGSSQLLQPGPVAGCPAAVVNADAAADAAPDASRSEPLGHVSCRMPRSGSLGLAAGAATAAAARQASHADRQVQQQPQGSWVCSDAAARRLISHRQRQQQPWHPSAADATSPMGVEVDCAAPPASAAVVRAGATGCSGGNGPDGYGQDGQEFPNHVSEPNSMEPGVVSSGMGDLPAVMPRRRSTIPVTFGPGRKRASATGQLTVAAHDGRCAEVEVPGAGLSTGVGHESICESSWCTVHNGCRLGGPQGGVGSGAAGSLSPPGCYAVGGEGTCRCVDGGGDGTGGSDGRCSVLRTTGPPRVPPCGLASGRLRSGVSGPLPALLSDPSSADELVDNVGGCACPVLPGSVIGGDRSPG